MEVFKELFIVFMTVHTATQETPLEPKPGQDQTLLVNSTTRWMATLHPTVEGQRDYGYCVKSCSPMLLEIQWPRLNQQSQDILPPGRHAVDGMCEERSRGGLHPCAHPPSMDNPVLAPHVQQVERGWTPHQAGDMTRLPNAPPWERLGSGLTRGASCIVLLMPGPHPPHLPGCHRALSGERRMRRRLRE